MNPQAQPNNEVKQKQNCPGVDADCEYKSCKECDFVPEGLPTAPTCPLCGGEIKAVNKKANGNFGRIIGVTYISCTACSLTAKYRLTKIEALARFTKRPESVEAKILQRIKDDLNQSHKSAKMSSCDMSEEGNLLGLLNWIKSIEKELKGE